MTFWILIHERKHGGIDVFLRQADELNDLPDRQKVIEEAGGTLGNHEYTEWRGPFETDQIE